MILSGRLRILLIAAGLVTAFATLAIVLGQGNRGGVLVPDQARFLEDGANVQVVRWLARRWGVSEEQLAIIVEDTEPWMRVIGLLDLQSLASARIWIVDTGNKVGKQWEVALTEQELPREGNMFLLNEYVPQGAVDRSLVLRFYSTMTAWYGNLLGGLAIIEDVEYTDADDSSGTIKAYQSQKHLPTITIPFKNGGPQKWRAYQTPLTD